MPKNLFVVFLVTLMAMPIAYAADVTVYGVAHVSLDEAANDDPDPANRDSLFAISSNKSRIGLRGSEALSQSVKAIWQFENAVVLDNGGWGEGRDSYLGVAGSVGTLLAGKYVTPYRDSTERLDIFTDTRADYNAVIGSVDGRQVFNNRAPNIVEYRTPDDKRLRFSLAYVSNYGGADGTTDDNLPMTREDARHTAFSTALVLDSGPLYLSIAQESLKEYATGGGDAQATKFGAGWNFGQGTRVSFVWEDAKNGEQVGGKKVSRTAGYLGIAHVSGNNTWQLAYGRLDSLDSQADSGADFYALGYQRALSQRADFYVLYTALNNDANGLYVLQSPEYDGGVPPGPQDIAPGPGTHPYAFVLGMVYRFSTDF